jgi:hypothetical protein
MRLPKIAVFHNRDEPRQAITDVTRAPQADSIIAKFSARSTKRAMSRLQNLGN